MSVFTTKGVNEGGGKFITYGIREVIATGVEAKEAEGASTAKLFINFKEVNSEKTVTVQFPFSEKGAPHSLRKLKHLATKVVTEAEVDAIDAKSVTDFASAYAKLILNKPVRVKFSGEEIDGSRSGKRNWFKSVFNFPPFAESIKTTPTTLVFDEVRDLKRLAPVASTPATAGTGNASDLPF